MWKVVKRLGRSPRRSPIHVPRSFLLKGKRVPCLPLKVGPPPAIKSWLRQCLNERIVVTINASAYLIQHFWLMVLSQDLEEWRAHAQRRSRYWCSNTSHLFFWCGRKGGIIVVSVGFISAMCATVSDFIVVSA